MKRDINKETQVTMEKNHSITQQLASIRDYSTLFNHEIYGFNFPTGITLFFTLVLSTLSWLVWRKSVSLLFHDPFATFLIIGIIFDAITALLFVIISHAVTNIAKLSLAWGLCVSLLQMCERILHKTFFNPLLTEGMRIMDFLSARYLFNHFVFGMCFMASLIIVIKKWGIKISTLVLGPVSAYVIAYLFLQIVNANFLPRAFLSHIDLLTMNVVHNAIIGVGLYAGLYWHLRNHYLQSGARPSVTMLVNELQQAVITHQTLHFKTLLDKVDDVNSVVKAEPSMLCYASQQGYDDIVNHILDKPVFVDDHVGSTALYLAAQNGFAHIVHALHKKGASVYARGEDGATALYIAAQNGHLEVVRLLLDSGVHPNDDGYETNTAIIPACTNGHHQVVQALLNKGADPNTSSSTGNRALSIAIDGGHLNTVKVLLQSDADVNIVDSDGFTPLMHAANKGNYDIVNTLLHHGANINTQTSKGTTALFYAAGKGFLDIVDVLLQNGADPKIKAIEGISPMEIAKSQHHDEVVKLLQEAGAEEEP